MLSEQRKKAGRARPTCLHTHIHIQTFSRGTFPRSCENLIKGDLTLLGGCVCERVCECGRVWESQGICKGQHKRWDDWKRERERWKEQPEREVWAWHSLRRTSLKRMESLTEGGEDMRRIFWSVVIACGLLVRTLLPVQLHFNHI